MIINDGFRFVFIHIPKCGGTSVRAALAELDDRKDVYFARGRSAHSALGSLDYHHIPLRTLKQYFREDFDCVKEYLGFAVVRNPYTRFPSSISERLIAFKGRRPDDLSEKEVRREIHEAVEYLTDSSLRLPIVDPKFIHFSRQVDYLEIDGERLIERIYPIERLSDMILEIGTMTDKELLYQVKKNQRLGYRFKGLKSIDAVLQRIVIASIPKHIWRPAFGTLKNALVRGGVLREWHKTYENLFETQSVTDFISEFYKDDIRIYKEAIEHGRSSGSAP